MQVLRELRYQHAMNRRLADYFLTIPPDALKENHETSHLNLADTFMHMVNMEDWYLHHVLPGKEWNGPAYDGFSDAAAMRERVLEVEKKTNAFTNGLAEEDLARPVNPEALGLEAPVSLSDYVSEVLMELAHHRGELLAILWRNDRQPPSVSFLEWAAENPA